MPLRSCDNSQVAVHTAGYALHGRDLYYLSVFGGQMSLKSIRATLTTGRSLAISGAGTAKMTKGELFDDALAPIPTTPFKHYLWKRQDPHLILVTRKDAAPTAKYLRYSSDEAQANRLLRTKLYTEAQEQLAPAKLVRFLQTETPLPIPPEWAVPIFNFVRHTSLLTTIDCGGDCIYAALALKDVEVWKQTILKLVDRGVLQ